MNRLPLLVYTIVILGASAACTPAENGDRAPTGATLSFEVTVMEGATEAWALLFQDELRRAAPLSVDGATGVAGGSVTDVPPGVWQALVLSASAPADGVLAGHALATLTLAAGDDEQVTMAMAPSSTAYWDLTFNPVGPLFPGTGELNPFSVPRLRAAMNLLLDREAVAALVPTGGAPGQFDAAFPLYGLPVLTTTNYRDLVGFIEGVERGLAPDAAAAAQVVEQEMLALGAERVDGAWRYDGEPVVVNLLIRDDDHRLQIGDLVADRLEDLGFATQRTYGGADETNPIWLTGDPADGLYHVYTGAWITTAYGESGDSRFSYFFTPDGLAVPLWQAYTPSAEFAGVASRLSAGGFVDEDERLSLVRQAIELALEDSVRVFLAQGFREAPAAP